MRLTNKKFKFDSDQRRSSVPQPCPLGPDCSCWASAGLSTTLVQFVCGAMSGVWEVLAVFCSWCCANNDAKGDPCWCCATKTHLEKRADSTKVCVISQKDNTNFSEQMQVKTAWKLTWGSSLRSACECAQMTGKLTHGSFPNRPNPA